MPMALDLFSGAGGLSEGLRRAGINVVGAVEIDELAVETYKQNHPGTLVWQKDIARVTGTELLTELNIGRGELDLLAACPPCQGFSAMRTKNGSRRNRDRRNDLIFDVLRLIRSMKPKNVMLENVPRLRLNRRFRIFCQSLEDLGYEVDFKVLNAADFGVPQRRRRLVLLASLMGSPIFAKPTANVRTVRQAIGNLKTPRNSTDRLHNYSPKRGERIRTLIHKIPHNGGSRSALGKKAQLECHRNTDGFKDVYGRMAWDSPSPTITGGCINPSKGRFLHPEADRAITLREAAILQTFPRSYKFPLSRGRYQTALLIGNALPPEMIRRHALALLGLEGKSSTKTAKL